MGYLVFVTLEGGLETEHKIEDDCAEVEDEKQAADRGPGKFALFFASKLQQVEVAAEKV